MIENPLECSPRTVVYTSVITLYKIFIFKLYQVQVRCTGNVCVCSAT